MNTRKIVISAEHISKKFELYDKPIDLLYEIIGKGKRHNVFWALKNINFEICEGQRLGIIGANGAGKSTLLKIITNNLTPTSGKMTVNGTISSMLSLTSFLNEHETGLENIKFNLEMKGVSKTEIKPLIEEIIDFTELGHFIYAPVKTYSTGMNARLAFAISTVLTPDILVVDEVLSVGDGYFVGKATQRMLELCKKGRALLYVNHSLAALQMLCDTALWLDKGTIRMHGPIEQVIKSYEEDFRRIEDINTRAGNKNKVWSLNQFFDKEVLQDSSVWILRVIPTHRKTFKDIHYIESVILEIDGIIFPVSFEKQIDAFKDQEAYLDIFNSEWGRTFERNGKICITLCAITGKFFGGHILIRKPTVEEGQSVNATIKLVYSSHVGLEEIEIEYLDEANAQWKPTTILEKNEEKEQNIVWKSIQFNCSLINADKASYQLTVKKLEENIISSVAILSADVFVYGQLTTIVRERVPFQIIIKAKITCSIPQLDFGIKLIRADGIVVFWQSSGQTLGNVAVNPGLLEIVFNFDPNMLSGGQYVISISAHNGWNIETNYPYSEVFDRKVNIASFMVLREFEMVDFGTINQRVNVTITSHQKTTIENTQAASIL